MGNTLSSSNADDTKAQASTPFPLMKLPFELRQQIYDCYFEDISVMTPAKSRYWFDKIIDAKTQKPASTSLPRNALSISVLGS